MPGAAVGVLAVAVILLGTLAGCEGRRGNFSQHPGFAAYFAKHPPSGASAASAEQELLERHRPRLWLPARHGPPIDFYADYIAHGELTDGTGRPVSGRVTRGQLQAHRRDPGAVFVHRPSPRPSASTVYGRLDREPVGLPVESGTVSETFTFLTYHAVFPASGLPAGLPGWKAWPLRLIASIDDWHQLDHYTAATLALDSELVPVALTLQQHNHLRTYVFGVDLALPADGRVALDVAIRSNELYPHVPGRTRRRAVSMPEIRAMRYLMTGRRQPFLSADDITDSVTETGYALAFLPADDALYTFQGYLGARRRLPGRDGPPGADYNTLPALKARGVQMLAFYWRDGDAGDLARFEAGVAEPEPLAAFARLQAPVFHRAWRCARARRSADVCRADPGVHSELPGARRSRIGPRG